MKQFAKYFILLLLLVSSFSLGAANQTIVFDFKNCGTGDDLKQTIEKYQEEVVFKGVTQKTIKGHTTTAIMVVTMSKAGSWSVFEYFNDDLVCLMESGLQGSQDFPGTIQI